MKDRRDGEKFMGEIEQSYTKLTDFFGALAKHRKRGQHLLAEIERAKRCFTLQLWNVTVVEDAYQKFGAGIDEMMNSFFCSLNNDCTMIKFKSFLQNTRKATIKRPVKDKYTKEKNVDV
ncbi:hypothetical protein QQG55_17360 [Brugia pahangi]